MQHAENCRRGKLHLAKENLVSSKRNKYTIPQNSEAHTTPILCMDDLITEVLRS